MIIVKAFILDVDHEQASELKIALPDGLKTTIASVEFAPYFYYEGKEKDVNKKRVLKVEKVEDKTKLAELEKGKKLFKLSFADPASMHEEHQHLKEKGVCYEHDIPLPFKFLIDNDLYTSKYYDFDVKHGRIASWKNLSEEPLALKACAFDLEVYNEHGMPNAERDDVIMIGAYDGKTKHSFVKDKNDPDDKRVIKQFLEFLKKGDYDVIISYNGSGFDFPYLKKRCAAHGLKLNLGRDESEVVIRKAGAFTKAEIFGRVHLDAYDAVELMTQIGALKLPNNDIDSVYKELFKKDKVKIEASKIWQYWLKGGKDLELLKKYNEEDTVAAYDIAQDVLPLFVEMSRILGLPLFEVARMSTAQMVEWALIREARKRGQLIPKRVREDVVKQRMMNPIKAAFVKEPEPGLHEHMVVCDFRSLYPHLIIIYNLDKQSLNCDCCKSNANVAPEVGHKFCKKHEGLMPKILREIVEVRAQAKKASQALNKEDPKYRMLYAKQWAMKIIANSAYGYLGYARARWYSREAAESTTAWGRHYLISTMEKAEKTGLHVIYGDTDGIFMKLKPDQKLEEAKEFVANINKTLPDKIELELQGYYLRGLFVSTREGGRGTKKKYALIRDDGTIEIVGFEFVRRDWSNIAKIAQEKVIQAVLREGRQEQAVQAVKDTIIDLRKNKVSIQDLKIYTQLTRKLSAYEQQAPHVRAAQLLQDAGVKTPAGMMLEFVVVKGKGKISDRSIPIQLLTEKHEPDAEYYINNQVLPATMKILRELGVNEDKLKNADQEGLQKWF